ncbi:hypothetical protein B296_00010337 [Ensete ventricosum]|uniref:glutathione transferase n=1 Tax=Ensete ventricosum TaxID=4639 RepID=A0A426ZKS2_ENSVE|nr:hypothetical protein B296_00010337 [Ensete ventricosum]
MHIPIDRDLSVPFKGRLVWSTQAVGFRGAQTRAQNHFRGIENKSVGSVRSFVPAMSYKGFRAIQEIKRSIDPLPSPSFQGSALMDQPSSLKLLGSWADSHTHRVQLALKLKSLEFDYQEEDVVNISPALLLHNPVYKKVPVLLHKGRPVVESVVILQYIDETWTGNPLMPADPFERAVARFWCHFAEDKVIPSMLMSKLDLSLALGLLQMQLAPAVGAVFSSSGEGQKAAVDQVHQNLKLLECEIRDGAFEGRRFFGGDKIGMLDIVLGCGSYWLSVFEEVMEVKLVDPESFPAFHAWLRDFEEQNEVKETIPAIDKLLEYARGVRQMMLTLSSSTITSVPATAAAAATTTGNDDVAVDAIDGSSG